MLNQEITLYHGSYCEVQTPDLAKCSGYKDFGRGFYLTTSKMQAEKFSLISLRRAVANGIVSTNQGYGIVSSFKCLAEEWNRLDMYEFEDADSEWLHCVVAHRKGGLFPNIVEQYHRYDIIGGKIANDATNATITAYMAGTYGIVGSDTAARLCISLLLPERLENQFCFRTQNALNALHFSGVYQVWK